MEKQEQNLSASSKGKGTLLLRKYIWDRIRFKFADVEVSLLRKAIVDMQHRPPSWVLDTTKLDEVLLEKLTGEIKDQGL